MCVREKINGLKNLVSNEVNEARIIGEGKSALDSLRSDWKSNREEFTTDDVVTLKEIGGILDAIGEFIEEQEGFKYISSKEEVDEVIGRLYYITEKVDGLKVSGRVHKEIRELLERKSTLPSQASSQRDSESKRAVAKLNANAPPCKRCGSNMVLRESNGDYFWGCSTFPECWGKKWLTNEEQRVLPD